MDAMQASSHAPRNRDSSALAQRIHQAVEADPDLNGKLIRIVR
jgi:hypothetical protein